VAQGGARETVAVLGIRAVQQHVHVPGCLDVRALVGGEMTGKLVFLFCGGV